MKRVFLLAIGFIFTGISVSFAQQQVVDGPPRDGVYDKANENGNVINRKPIPYVDIREADVMWQKRVWRIIDLSEKINHPLLYPENPHNQWKPMIRILLDALNEGAISAYEVTPTDEFFPVKSFASIDSMLNRSNLLHLTRPDPPYDPYDSVVKSSFRPFDVKQYKIKEDWFIDKQRSVLDVRIIGICPMVAYKNEKGEENGTVQSVCWFYFPEIRNILSKSEVFNRFNDAARLSFDDIFWKRMFGSVIIKESNVYDRSIRDYMTAMDQLLESEKIKDNIFKFEHDLWEY